MLTNDNVSVIETKQNSQGQLVVRYGFKNREGVGLSAVSLREVAPFAYDICIYNTDKNDVVTTNLFPYGDPYWESACQEDLDFLIEKLSSDEEIIFKGTV